MRSSFYLFAAVGITTVAGCSVVERCFGQSCQDGAGGQGGTVIPGTSGGSDGITAASGGIGGGVPGTSSTGGGMSSTASTGGNGSHCGGKTGLACGPTEYCDYPDDLCAIADGFGTCAPRPAGCPDFVEPTCGCDGKVHGNTCEAYAVGVDIFNGGGCDAPAGTFGCGAHFCDKKGQYCQRKLAQQPGTADSYACVDIPATCGTTPNCQCIAATACGTKCEGTTDGGLLVTCD